MGMNKTRTGFALAALLAGAPIMACASDSSGLYAVVEGGLLNYDTGAMNAYYGALAGPTFTSTSYGYSFGSNFVGYPVRGLVGYQFNSRWAVEAGGIFFSKITYSGASATGSVTATSRAGGSSFTVVSIASGGQPGDYVSLLVKLGASAIHSASTVNSTFGGTMSPLGQGDKVGITYGLGILSDVTDSFSFRFDWDSYLMPPNASNTRINTWLIGAGYKF
jgi:hypothetical protein